MKDYDDFSSEEDSREPYDDWSPFAPFSGEPGQPAEPVSESDVAPASKRSNEDRDYFDDPDPDPDEEKPRKPKQPKYKTDDPRYWERESQWDHLKPRRRIRIYLWLTVAAVIVAAIVTVYIRYFSPYIEGATQYGYVEDIRQEGMVFKTFEGLLIPYKELMDTTRIYQRDFAFTAADEHVAAELKRAQLARRPVRVEYKRYFGVLPGRGASQVIITYVDSVDPRRILPPEFNGNKLP